MMKLGSCLLLLILAANSHGQLKTEEPDVRKEIKVRVASLWQAEQFDELDAMATTYRTSRGRTPSGVWQLSVFYSALREQVESDGRDSRVWAAQLERARRWTTRTPTSPSAHIQYAEALTRQAWHQRGDGFARSVTAEALVQFRTTLALARKHLEDNRKAAQVDPGYYASLLLMAVWQGWPKAQVQGLLEEALSREKEFWPTYMAVVEYHSPYWHGSAAELERFASFAAERLGEPDGDMLYARIYWYAADRYFDGQFFGSKISCERMMRGIDRLVALNPDGWNVNYAAGFAVSCGDKGRAKALFDRIGERPLLEAFGGSSKNFAHFRAWANQ